MCRREIIICGLIFCFLLPLISVGLVAADISSPPIVFALCRPSVGQIKNIVELFERDLIAFPSIAVIGVYHEDEETDYKLSQQYVQTEKLQWFSFYVIKGKVAGDDIYKKNIWSAQFADVFAKTQGIIFTGGMDIPPRLYGAEENLLTEATTPIRSTYEISFLCHLLGSSRNADLVPLLQMKPNYVVLGICLGTQSMNVATGGTLIQDIPTQVYGKSTVQEILRMDSNMIHSGLYNARTDTNASDIMPAFHQIAFAPDSIFIRDLHYKATQHPIVLSSHHQAIDRLGEQLRIAARSLDGRIVEAIQHTRFQHVLGVQFHPEVADLYKKGPMYKTTPQSGLLINLRAYLNRDTLSFPFHQALWQWFSTSLSTKH